MNFRFSIINFRFLGAVLLLSATIWAQHDHAGHDHSHGEEEPAAAVTTGAKPAVASAVSERNLQTDAGQFNIRLTRTPADPRTGEMMQFVLRAAEKRADGTLSAFANPVVSANLTTANGASVAGNLPIHADGAGRSRLAHNFSGAGDYKIVFNVTTEDNRNFTVDFPVAVTAAPVNWSFWIGFIILSLLTAGAVGAIFSAFGRGESFNSKARKVAPFVVAVVIFFTFGTFALAYFQPSTPPRTIPETAGAEAEPPAEIKNALVGKLTVSKESQLLFGIKTEPVGTEIIKSGLKTNGVVRAAPDARAVVAPQVGGKIVLKSGLTIGSAVGKGEQIGTIEQVLDVSAQADLESQRLEAEGQQREIEVRRLEMRNKVLELQAQQAAQRAAASQARTRVEQAKRELSRAERLLEVGAAPRKRVEEAQTALKVVEQEQTSAEQQVKLLEAQIKSANAGQNVFRQPRINQPRRTFPLVAPVGGIVNEIKATSGSQVQSGSEILSIVNLSRVLLEAQVFEGTLPQIRESESASFTSPSLGGEIFKIDGTDGDLLTIGQNVNAETRTVSVIYQVINPLQRLREGMFVEITIDTGGETEVLAVPKRAVVRENGETIIFVFTGGETFERRLVTLGAEGSEFYEVKTGLKKFDRVVVEGVYQLRTTKPAS